MSNVHYLRTNDQTRARIDALFEEVVVMQRLLGLTLIERWEAAEAIEILDRITERAYAIEPDTNSGGTAE